MAGPKASKEQVQALLRDKVASAAKEIDRMREANLSAMEVYANRVAAEIRQTAASYGYSANAVVTWASQGPTKIYPVIQSGSGLSPKITVR